MPRLRRYSVGFTSNDARASEPAVPDSVAAAVAIGGGGDGSAIRYAEGNFPAVYVSGGQRARVIVILSWVMMVLGWAMLWPIVHRILAWRGAMTGDYYITEDDLVTAEYTLPDLVGLGLDLVYVLVALTAFIVWLMWSTAPTRT